MLRRAWLSVLIGCVLAAPALAEAKKQKKSPFAVEPRQAFAMLAELTKVSGQKQAIAAVETQFFADLAAGKEDQWSFAEMALIASGAVGAEERQGLLKRLTALEAQAKQALAAEESERGKAEALLRFLHAKPMAKGYQGKQTLLSGVLESGRFNCVSSAVLYNVMGRRLGLNVRAVEIPGTYMTGHVFSVLRAEGAVIDIETTNKAGFNPEGKRERPDGGGYDPAKDGDNRREVGDRELAAIIYYNRGVDLSKDQQFHPAIVMYLRALCVDPANQSAAKNIVADLNKWGRKLSEQSKYEDAVAVMDVAVKLAPGEDGLSNNYKILWLEYATAELKAGREDQAVAAARRGAAILKDDDAVLLPARAYQKVAEDLIKAGRWEQAIALGRSGAGRLDGAAAKELRSWYADLHPRWADRLRRDKAWSQAYDVLAKARAEDPDDDRLVNDVLVTVRDQLRDAAGKAPAKVQECVAESRRRFPKLAGLEEIFIDHVHQEVRKHTGRKRWQEALTTLAGHKELLAQAKDAQEVGVYIYDQWARARKADGWQKVLEVYVQGLKAYPGDELLTGNAVATVDAQGVPLMNKKKFREAIEVFEAGLRAVPDHPHLVMRLKTCREGVKD